MVGNDKTSLLLRKRHENKRHNLIFLQLAHIIDILSSLSSDLYLFFREEITEATKTYNGFRWYFVRFVKKKRNKNKKKK